MRYVGIALCVALAACATAPQAPCPPTIAPKPYAVPVAVKCIDAPDVPAEPGAVSLTGDARNDDALLAAKLAAVRVWGRSLAAMIAPCTK